MAASAVTAKSKKKQKGKKGKAAPVPRTEVARLVRAMRPAGHAANSSACCAPCCRTSRCTAVSSRRVSHVRMRRAHQYSTERRLAAVPAVGLDAVAPGAQQSAYGAVLCAVHQKRTSMRSSRSLASKPTCALAPRAKRARGCWAARASSASRHRDRRPPARPPSLVVSDLAISFPFSNPDGSAQLQRYCLEHAMPEIHGCADDAKAHARNAWLLDSSKKLAAEQARWPACRLGRPRPASAV